MTIWRNLELAALRHAGLPALHYFGSVLTYRQVLREAESLASWLTYGAGIGQGDRVLLHMQNCPQWVIAYYAAQRADAVVVPSNPMNAEREIRHCLQSSGAKVVVCAADEADKVLLAARSTEVRHIVTVSYSDYLPQAPAADLPEWIVAPAGAVSGCETWSGVVSDAGRRPLDPARAQPGDLCLLLYTSGSTGPSKGCMHTHRSLMHVAAGLAWWHSVTPGSACLGVSPMSHIGGINHCINMPAFAGASVALLPRWRRDLAAQLIERHRIGHVGIAPTAIIDLLADPGLSRYDLTSMRRIASAGAPIADATLAKVAERLRVPVIQSYGMSETAGATHSNPFERPRNCLGVPFFDTRAVILDPVTRRVLGEGEAGEIAVSGPQLFIGYWQAPEASSAAFIDTDQGRFLLTGDLGHFDGDGYFWMRDRLKRLINASGFKVAPTEVEGVLLEHAAVKEVCVVGASDAYRGETVKAVVVLDAAHAGKVSAAELIEWSRSRMATYKYPRIVEFVDELPKSTSGKVLWQKLQERARGPVQ
ncbi:MAG: AMP-binding protein [Lautropia sp.]